MAKRRTGRVSTTTRGGPSQWRYTAMTLNRMVLSWPIGIGLAVALTMPSPAHGQIKITPAPPGAPEPIATAAINDADHPCGTVLDAIRLGDGSIRAVCSNGATYRIFDVQGRLVAMKCS